MARRKRRDGKAHAGKAGLPPGAAVYTGSVTDAPIYARVFDYSGTSMNEVTEGTFAEVRPFRDTPSVSWIDFLGLHDAEQVHEVGVHFGVHPLAIEDVLSPETRPKVDDYGDTLCLTAKMCEVDSDTDLRFEHIAIVLGPTWVLSFQERLGDPFEPVRRRIRTGSGRVRDMGADYLFHLLLDAIVDGYFVALSALEDRVEVIEQAVFEGHAAGPAQEVHAIRGEVLALRRAISPLRVAVASILRDASPQITASVRPYVRDVLDHLDLLLDRLDGARERLTSVLEVHLAVTSRKTNEVMRGLTVVATVFIPLTFIAGVYGMNFEWMPELTLWWAYPAVLAGMGILAGTMLWWMRRRGWM
jgi:magnesium transporter